MKYRRDSLRWVGRVLVLVALVTACGRRGGGGSADGETPDNVPIVPVVTSVVGLTPPSSSSAESDSPTTLAGGASTTTVAGYGESNQPMTVPTTASPPSGPQAAAAEAVAKAFLDHYWSDRARTGAQVADDIAPYATDRLLAIYRDPARADQAVPADGVGEITVKATDATSGAATVAGQGVKVDEPGRRVVYRTLSLVRQGGDWRVDSVR